MSERVLIVGLGWLDAPGGLERYMADLRAELGDPSTVVLSRRCEPAPGVVVAASPDASLLTRWRGVRRACEAAAPGAQVVDLHFPLTALAARSSPAVRRLPVVTHFQGPWADEASSARRLRRGLERCAQRGSERFVVLSGYMGRILIERYRTEPWRVEVVPPGVDVDRFSPGDRRAARQRLEVPDDALVAVCVRRLVPRTGVHVLLDAWARAADDLPAGAVLLVAGDGSQRAALDSQLDRLAPERAVRMLGGVSEAVLLDLYQAADVSVVPSVALEGFGLVALESLACGTPTLVTHCGGLPDAVDGLGPPPIEPGDPDALACALVAAASGRLPERDRCRTHAQGFAWPAVAERHRAIYAEAAARRPPPGRRVVVIDHSAARSGGEIALARLVSASAATRFHAILFEEGPFEGMLWRAGATAEIRPLGRAGSVSRTVAAMPRTLLRHGSSTAAHALRLAWRLRRLRPDLIHANSLKAGLVGGIAARLAGVPMVWHLRDRLADDYLPSRTARLVRLASRHLAVAVIVPSRAVLDTLGPPGRRGQERVVIPDPHPLRPLPSRHGGGSRPLQVTMVGRLAPWKGQDVFLDAFAAAFPTGDARAALVGGALFGAEEQAYADRLARLVIELGLEDRVSLLGERDDVAELLAGADIVVHASRSPEPFGQVIVEGMAAGAAVIATEGGGASELIRPGVDGLLVRPGSVDAMAAALRQLAADPAERVRLGASAHARVGELTAPDRIACAVAGVHERAAARGRRPVRGTR